jgi:hypothetical protein
MEFGNGFLDEKYVRHKPSILMCKMRLIACLEKRND